MAPIIIFFVFVALGVVGNIVAQNVANANKNKGKEDITHHEWSAGDSLEHEDCKTQVGDSCLHNDNVSERDVNACSKCGFKNEKSARKCSVCGNRLWKL